MMAARIRQYLCEVTEAPTLALAVRRVGEYAALRLWALIIGCFPIELNLSTARLMGRLWWLLMKRHRDRALDHLRPALGDRYGERELRRIARRSFEHFAQLYLVELVLTPRLINPWSWARYVELDQLGPALRELLAARGTILLTGHFGNYELLGYTISRLGLPLTAVMRPVDNPLINEYVERSRRAGGLSLLYKKGVSAIAGELIDQGAALSFIADQDAGRKGLFVAFFGRPASTYKSIGLLAMAKRVPIIVGHAVRVRRGFHYRIGVERIIQPEEWDGRDDPLRWITQEYTAALEAAIRRHPEQYLWVHRRWKHQPRPRD
jgi:KDO2-lipid IV(A) lauroyltransferase